MKRPSFTIGIEEEYMTVDPQTRELRSHIDAEMIEKGKLVLRERVKPEMHQCVVEVGTDICHNVQEARAEIVTIRRQMVDLAKANGLRLAAAATHPFSDWRNQSIYDDARYHTLVEDMQLATTHTHGPKYTHKICLLVLKMRDYLILRLGERIVHGSLKREVPWRRWI